MSNKWETWIIELAAYIWNVTLWAWFCFYLPHLQISSNFTSTTPSLPSTVFTWFLIKSPIHKIKFLTFQILPTLWVWPPTSFIYWRLPLWYQLFVTMPIFVPKDDCGAHSWEPQTMRAWQFPDVCWHHRTSLMSHGTMMQPLCQVKYATVLYVYAVLPSLGVEKATLAQVDSGAHWASWLRVREGDIRGEGVTDSSSSGLLCNTNQTFSTPTPGNPSGFSASIASQ